MVAEKKEKLSVNVLFFHLANLKLSCTEQYTLPLTVLIRSPAGWRGLSKQVQCQLIYPGWSKKRYPNFIFAITSVNVHRFLQFFHC